MADGARHILIQDLFQRNVQKPRIRYRPLVFLPGRFRIRSGALSCLCSSLLRALHRSHSYRIMARLEFHLVGGHCLVDLLIRDPALQQTDEKLLSHDRQTRLIIRTETALIFLLIDLPN